ncbi:alpha/beta fold hydrolase [Peterkaempfera bronchialis]|uniref:Alpha/beta fold hydrolase n=1 Tax=Peterkaempfera bronchialis TaxID=2126346 RepID=A0A345T5Q3_9ACTN|nr:alpha/beta fold hydrolase [Peterkaempfera bronchialis]AXI81308.1 alpha/beta fold hydrolase [Peterkaempfera bronchialis]
MQLHTRTWGTGHRTALLVHGMMSDHRSWRRVGPRLAALGYRVLAVDLRGHGRSPRGHGADPVQRYRPDLLAQDLVDTLPAEADLAVGHSLGGLALSLAVDRLRPRRAVYSDPAWCIRGPGRGLDPAGFAWFRTAAREQIAALNPRWEASDVDLELATIALWDPDTGGGLAELAGRALLPERPTVPSLVQLADPSFVIGPEHAAELSRRGFEVRTVAGAGHTIHRDDLPGFLASLDGWI